MRISLFPFQISKSIRFYHDENKLIKNQDTRLSHIDIFKKINDSFRDIDAKFEIGMLVVFFGMWDFFARYTWFVDVEIEAPFETLMSDLNRTASEISKSVPTSKSIDNDTDLKPDENHHKDNTTSVKATPHHVSQHTQGPYKPVSLYIHNHRYRDTKFYSSCLSVSHPTSASTTTQTTVRAIRAALIRPYSLRPVQLTRQWQARMECPHPIFKCTQSVPIDPTAYNNNNNTTRPTTIWTQTVIQVFEKKTGCMSYLC